MDRLPSGTFWSKRRYLPWFVLVFWIAISPEPVSGQTQSEDFDGIAGQAAAARDQNDVPRAIGLYAQAVQRKPDWSAGLWFLGSLQYGAGNYASARDVLTRFIALNPNAGPALALRGLCEFETGEYSQSLADIQRAASLGAANQPRNERILHYHEALLLTRAGKFEDALGLYAFFAHDEVPNPELIMAIGLAGLRAPLLPKEVAAEQQELFRAAGKATFRFLGGDVSAGSAFQDLFQRFPSAANAHYLYGYLLFGKDPDQSFAEFKRELEIAPTNAAAHVMLAWYYLLKDNAREALAYIEKAVQEDPTLRAEQLILGRCLVETGNLKSGIEHLEQALRLEPNNVEIHMALAKAYSKSGRKEDARRERLESLKTTQKEVGSVEHP